jgi:hypothetical protein
MASEFHHVPCPKDRNTYYIVLEHYIIKSIMLYIPLNDMKFLHISSNYLFIHAFVTTKFGQTYIQYGNRI